MSLHTMSVIFYQAGSPYCGRARNDFQLSLNGSGDLHHTLCRRASRLHSLFCKPERSRIMKEDYFECPELSGKTIQTLRIYNDTRDGTDMQIDLTDGTSFSCSLCHQPTVKAVLYRGGIGSPEIIRDYEL